MTIPYTPYRPEDKGQPIDGVGIRAATTADVSRIAAIDAERNGSSVERIAPLIDRDLQRIASGEVRRYTCVALIRDDVVAFAKCAFMDWEDRADSDLPEGWYLAGVVVDPEVRRRGIARLLTRHRLDWVARQADAVYYWADEVNSASIDLHREFGFEQIGRDLLISSHHNQNRQALYRAELAADSQKGPAP